MRGLSLRVAALTTALMGVVNGGMALWLVAPANRGRALVLAALAALLSGLLVGAFTHRYAALLARLEGALQRLAEGDFQARILAPQRAREHVLLTAFNQTAERLQAHAAVLAEVQSRLAAIVDHAAEGVVITDAAGHVLLLNPAAARLLQVDATTATTRVLAEVAPFPTLLSLWEACLRAPEKQTDIVEVPSRGLVLQVTGVTFGEGRQCLLLLYDLSRFRQMETMRSDFVSNLSHELRTPLAGMKAVVETLSEGAWEDPPAAKRFLRHMETELDNLIQMVEEMLTLSRLESGQEVLQKEWLCPEDILHEPVAQLMPYARRAEVALEVQLPPGLPPLLADRRRIQRAVLNLVHNAIKFTPAGGRVVVAAVEDADEVVFTVRDTGRGIPLDDLPRIFERFYKSRDSQGSGLGLAIAKHTIQMHGGRIWAESVEGQGSTVGFALPKGVEAPAVFC